MMWDDAEERVWLLHRQRSSTLRLYRYVAAMVIAATTAWHLGYVEPMLPFPKTPTTVAAIPGPAPLDALTALVEVDSALLASVAKQEDANAAEAVAWVILNRAGCEIGPEGYACQRPFAEVITEGHAFGTWLDGRWIRSWGRTWSGTADRRELRAVREDVTAVLLGDVPDPTGGATHFHRLGTWTPEWAPSPGKWRKIGVHAFYREVIPVTVAGNFQESFSYGGIGE